MSVMKRKCGKKGKQSQYTDKIKMPEEEERQGIL